MDFTKPASKWNISPQGEIQARNLIFHPILAGGSHFDQIICSSEPKTVQSIMPFLDYWHYNYTLDGIFDEVRTESLPTTDRRQYLNNKKYAFNNQSYFSETQESFDHALERFNQGIKDVTLRFPNGKILIVSHATILTLYFGQLQGDLENGEKLYQQWVNLQFGAVGVINDSRITQNIHDNKNEKDEKNNKGPFKLS